MVATLAAARRAAESFMSDMQRLELPWPEEHVTSVLWRAAAPVIKTAAFTSAQEGAVGADWLWWWIDSEGYCFGMLVQAKKLHRRGSRFTVDFGYRDGKQMGRLFETAELFAVPAVYALYCGDVDYRAGLSCGPQHRDPCARCSKAGVSMLAGLLAEQAGHDPRYAAEEALGHSVALEDLADPTVAAGPIVDLNWRATEPQLRAFLAQGQQGAKHVARTIFSTVSRARAGMFSVAVEDHVNTDVPGEPVFPVLPMDRGHLRVPYFPHILRGLRTTPPGYVQDVLAGVEPPAWVRDKVAGVVVVPC
ncbi:hypothetical protein [Alloactinosynnema sp. L-07]|nr:hypothetical protein [Alloactinosynnema sp. L-07]